MTKPRAALIVVDMQPDFLPQGALGVSGGDEVLQPIAALMDGSLFDLIVATQDWHPPGHISFASSHPGHQAFDEIELYGHSQVLWPDHCIAGSRGAELVAGLPWRRASAIIRKGTDPKVDSYSTFRNNWNERSLRPPTGLGGYLQERGVTDVYLCGLARDYCVAWSAEDAAELGFTTAVVWDLTRPVDAGSDADTRAALCARGVDIVDSSELGAE
jgi:nicotinamidase/pyrazinamidase